MQINQIIEMLMAFGVTRQEANVFYALTKNGTMTGYEVAKQTGISRSNSYNALAGLVDKGFCYQEEGSVKKYTPLDITEICDNKIQALQNIKQLLVINMPKPEVETEGYLSIYGDKNIEDKMRYMLKEAKQRVYLEMDQVFLNRFQEELLELIKHKIKVVILTNDEIDFKGAKVYKTQPRNNQIGMITDSSYVLTGEFGRGDSSCSLFTGQKNFVQVFKDSMKNEIKLIELVKGE